MILEEVYQQIRDQIFESRFTTKEKGIGSGFGLAISKKIALGHNGDLYLSSEKEKTTFNLKIPLSQEAETSQ